MKRVVNHADLQVRKDGSGYLDMEILQETDAHGPVVEQVVVFLLFLRVSVYTDERNGQDGQDCNGFFHRFVLFNHSKDRNISL